MKPILMTTVAAVISILGANALAARQHSGHTGPASQEVAPQVFCETMQTGQLCTHGTSESLGLSPDKRDAWVAAVRKYNASVKQAIATLRADSEGTLSAAQRAEVERWFAVGMNTQVNRLLMVPARARGKQE